MNIILGNWKHLSVSELRLCPKYTQNKGFFCSLTWLLESLPYVEEHYLDKIPFGFEFYSHNYGSYPNFSVFGKYLITHFPSLSEPIKTVDIKDFLNYKNLTSNFQYAHDLFFKYFDFSTEIYNESSILTDSFTNKKILGLHFRGTDKLGVNWADHTGVDDFLLIIDDYLSKNQIDGIFFCTDSLHFKNSMFSKYSNTYTLYYNQNQYVSEKPLHLSRLKVLENITKSIKNGNSLEKELEIECITNEHELKQVIVDCLVLSKCSTVIKTHSLVSSFSKIINPELEIYRLNGCSELYYPESYIPFYTTNNSDLQIILEQSKKLPF
jgi:hypothetical protein